MDPKVIYLMRHCDESDNPDDPCCNEKGCIRSALLVGLFQNILKEPPRLLLAPKFGPPCDPSERSSQILVPLSKFYHLPIFGRFCSNQPKEQAKDIIRLPDCKFPIILAWEHKALTGLVANLLNYCNPPTIENYPGDRFDIVFKVTIHDKYSRLEIFTQNLFPEDPATLPAGYQIFGVGNEIIFPHPKCIYDKTNCEILNKYSIINPNCTCT